MKEPTVQLAHLECWTKALWHTVLRPLQLLLRLRRRNSSLAQLHYHVRDLVVFLTMMARNGVLALDNSLLKHGSIRPVSHPICMTSLQNGTHQDNLDGDYIRTRQA